MFRKSYLFFLVLIFFSCEEPPELGLDPDEFVPPETVLVTLSETTFTSSSITIEWAGNESSRIFDYRLEYDDDPSIPHIWSAPDTTSANFVNFLDLDEGAYTFYISSRFDTDNIEIEQSISFIVDAISGPSLRIYPLNQTAQTGDTIDVYLYMEEVSPESAVTGLEVDIEINANELTFDTTYTQGALVAGLSATGITTIWPNPSYSEDGATMSIIGVVEGNGLSGTGSLMKFSITVLASAGTHNIHIGAENSLLNINNEPIEFSSQISGSVTVAP